MALELVLELDCWSLNPVTVWLRWTRVTAEAGMDGSRTRTSSSSRTISCLLGGITRNIKDLSLFWTGMIDPFDLPYVPGILFGG